MLLATSGYIKSRRNLMFMSISVRYEWLTKVLINRKPLTMMRHFIWSLSWSLLEQYTFVIVLLDWTIQQLILRLFFFMISLTGMTRSFTCDNQQHLLTFYIHQLRRSLYNLKQALQAYIFVLAFSLISLIFMAFKPIILCLF